MRKYVSAAIVALSFTLLCPISAFAQWDYGQDWMWNMADARRDIRRTRERIRARQGKGKSSKGSKASRRTGRKSSRKAVKRPAVVKKVVAPLPRYGIEIRRDSYQDFHREDINGFKVNFTFVSQATGKTLLKSGYCKLYDMDSAIEGVPAGTYNVSVKVPYGGKIYPAHIGSKEGSTENPKGGDFAPSMKIVLKPIIDDGGSRVMGVFPEKLYVRVLE